MFNEAYKKLELDEVAIILESINEKVDGSIFDPLETTILAIEVPFYPSYRFLDISDHTTLPPLQRYAFQKGSEFILLNWSYKPIYKLNQDAPIKLSDENIFEYIRFFFAHVRGRHGRFIICENMENIKWKEEPESTARKALGKVIQPMTILEKRRDNVYKIDARMMLKDALFKVDVYVEPNGRITLSNHELLLENMPVLDQAVGQ